MATKKSDKIDRRKAYVVTQKIVDGLPKGREVKVHDEEEESGDVFIEVFEDHAQLVDGKIEKHPQSMIYRITRQTFDTKTEPKTGA